MPRSASGHSIASLSASQGGARESEVDAFQSAVAPHNKAQLLSSLCTLSCSSSRKGHLLRQTYMIMQRCRLAHVDLVHTEKKVEDGQCLEACKLARKQVCRDL